MNNYDVLHNARNSGGMDMPGGMVEYIVEVTDKKGVLRIRANDKRVGIAADILYSAREIVEAVKLKSLWTDHNLFIRPVDHGTRWGYARKLINDIVRNELDICAEEQKHRELIKILHGEPCTDVQVDDTHTDAGMFQQGSI